MSIGAFSALTMVIIIVADLIVNAREYTSRFQAWAKSKLCRQSLITFVVLFAVPALILLLAVIYGTFAMR